MDSWLTIQNGLMVDHTMNGLMIDKIVHGLMIDNLVHERMVLPYGAWTHG